MSAIADIRVLEDEEDDPLKIEWSLATMNLSSSL
jgi:hypothetical protein